MRRILLLTLVVALVLCFSSVAFAKTAHALSAPSNLTATAASSSEIDLSWTDNSTNETQFQVERSANGSSGWTQIGTTNQNVTTYADTGLTASTTYYYRVRAKNNSTHSSYSNTANATTQASGGGGTLAFQDDFEESTFTPAPWDSYCYGGAGGGITTDTTHARTGTYGAKFTVYDGDCTSFPTRANVRWQEHFAEGSENYIGYSMYLPSDFPCPNPSWMNLGQFGFGPPWGYPPMQFSYYCNSGGSGMVLYDQSTTTKADFPVTRGAWNDLVLHVKWSSNPSIGFVELWRNGSPITMSNGQTRTYMNTLRTDATGPGSFDLQQYRGAGWPNPLSVWFDSAKVGSSYADVAPA